MLEIGSLGRRPVWRPESEGLGHAFDFSPGEALHIPFAAGHHVRNGSDDVSISLSIIFKTAQTRQLMRAMQFNHYARRGLAPVGLTPRRVARHWARRQPRPSSRQDGNPSSGRIRRLHPLS